MTEREALLERLPALAPFLERADHLDVKSIEAETDLRSFAAGMLSYQPAWLRALFAARWLLVRMLGMRQEGMPPADTVQPAEISMVPGEPAGIFTVTLAEEERHWVIGVEESHLAAWLGVLAEPLSSGRRRFHVLTIVRYNRWTGPVYFNSVRPFHHFVVRAMMKAGATPWPRSEVHGDSPGGG